MAQDLFLGIDIGTGGVRACAIDAQARIVGIATTALPAPRQEGDAIDQAPALWWDAMVETIGKLAVDQGRHPAHLGRWHVGHAAADRWRRPGR